MFPKIIRSRNTSVTSKFWPLLKSQLNKLPQAQFC